MGDVNVVSRAKKLWLFDLCMFQDDFPFVPLAVQIELLHRDPSLSTRISPFIYANYLMFLCYHELGQYENRDRALHQLVDTLNNLQRCGLATNHSNNIVGHCMLMAGNKEMARDIFSRSILFTPLTRLIFRSTERCAIQ